MNSWNIAESKSHLELLKKESQLAQKKGLPFMLSSIGIWGLILLVRSLPLEIQTVNLGCFMCSCFLMPLAFLFSKILRVDLFRKTDNPIDKLAFLCTLNQMLYLLIGMWAFRAKPDAMIMLYARVFGAHLLPYGWVYDSKAYTVAAIANTVGSLIIAYTLGTFAMICFVIAVQIAGCIALFAELRKV